MSDIHEHRLEQASNEQASLPQHHGNAPWTERERAIVGEVVKAGVDIQATCQKLEGLFPILKMKLNDPAIFEPVAECQTSILMATVSLEHAIKSRQPKPLISGYPNEIRGSGPQPEDYDSFEAWCRARKEWVAERMMKK